MTLGLAAALVAHAETPDEVVTRVLQILLDGANELAETHYRAGFNSRETVCLGIAAPLHPATTRFYEKR